MDAETLAQRLHASAKQGGFASDELRWEDLPVNVKADYVILATRALAELGPRGTLHIGGPDELRAALASNDRIGEPAVDDKTRSKGPHDLLAPSGLAIAASLGIPADAINEIAKVFFEHVGGGQASVEEVCGDAQGSALSVGLVMGWLARLRQEQEAVAGGES